MRSIGFIGLGIMGRPMALRILDGGHALYAYKRGTVPEELVAQGAVVCASPADVARQSDIVIMMLPDTPDVEGVLFGEHGIAEGLVPGKIVIDMSSISPLATRKFADSIEQLGCSYLDAPVSGGEVGAKNGTLTIMVGGRLDVFEQVRPLFDLLGKNITLIGSHGDGQTAKVANQIIVALTIEAVGEALLFASLAGADAEKVRQALMGGFASSRILELHGARMIARNFDPGFRMELHRKDLKLALEGAASLNLSLPHTASCHQLMNAAIANGGAKWDHSALVRVLEMMANLPIGEHR